MNYQTWQQGCINNPYQNLAQSASTDLLNNLSLEPTVRDLNRPIELGAGTSTFNTGIGIDEEGEPLFGTHLREAATTFKKIFSR